MALLAGTSILMLEVVTGGWLDLTSRRLPNWLCLVTLISGLGFVAAELGLAPAAWALAHSVIALIVGMVLFRFEAIGAGMVADRVHYVQTRAASALLDRIERRRLDAMFRTSQPPAC